jgi:hypothetical protein
MHSTMHLYPIDGRRRVGKDDTAWSYRDAKWAQVIVWWIRSGKQDTIVNYPPVLGGPASVFCGRRLRELRRWTRERNARDVSGQLWTAGNDQDEIRPDNFFRVNQNIQPKAGGGRRLGKRVKQAPLTGARTGSW